MLFTVCRWGTYRAVKTQSEEHDEKDHGPQIGEWQLGQGLRVSDKTQTGPCRKNKNVSITLT